MARSAIGINGLFGAFRYMIIQHNLLAMNSNRMLGLSKTKSSKSTEKLSSGYRINRSADDAAGLAISEKMRRQIRGLTQASANCQDGVSLCQIADGALNEVHDMLKRCEELVVQAANDTNTEDDREYIQMELDQISQEIDRVHETTVFNDQNIFSDQGIDPAFVRSENSSADILIDSEGSYVIPLTSGQTITLSIVDKDGYKVAVPNDSSAVGSVNEDAVKDSSLARFAQKAAASAVSRIASNFPKLFAAGSTKNIQIGLQLMNIDNESGTLATASLSYSGNRSGAIMSYSMTIDTSDYPIDKFDEFDDAKKADLAAVIAHEMTHLITYDTIFENDWNTATDNWPGGLFDPAQNWFIEGIAQTSSGDNGWFYLNKDSTDAEILDYMSTLKVEYPGGLGTYGAGYAATMYLGMLASGAPMSEVSSANIAKGLDNIMTYMATHKIPDNDLGDAIMACTKYDDSYELEPGTYDAPYQAFVHDFKTGNNGALDFVKKLIDLRGDDGAGSILYDLDTPESTAFAPASLNGSYDSYNINADNRWYGNSFGNIDEIPDDYHVADSKPRTPGGGGIGGGNGNGFKLQAGAESGQYIYIDQFNISASALLGGQKIDVTGAYSDSRDAGYAGTEEIHGATVSQGDASSRGNAISIIKEADRKVSLIRAYYGATQNRIEHTIKNLDNIVENTTAAESQIRDTDMASEMVDFSNTNILMQAGQAMLAQSNQSNQGILTLLS